MCGINGIFAYGSQAPAPSEQECLAVRDVMSHRGPDGAGLYRDPERPVLLGHRRLEIIDLTAGGSQPMATADGDLVITFNGEIYNYRELQAELEAEGVALASASDTEVLLHLYRRRGESMVDALEGMFAFAIWDRRRETLFLARDPHGIKPLYTSDDGSVFRFASSVRALLAGGGISREVDAESVLGFLAWGSVPEPGTLCRSVRALPAGSTQQVRPERVSAPRSFWSPASAYSASAPALGGQELRHQTRQALLESVGRHLVADVPVGLFLSAGVDSGALLGLASELHRGALQTVTLTFEEFQGKAEDEAPLAARVARHYGAEHKAVTLSVASARRDLDGFLAAMDQPTVDGLNVFWISRAVREAGLKAALSGLGGDELFGGYRTFSDFARLRRFGWSRHAPWVWRLGRKLSPRRRRAKMGYLPTALARPASIYHLLRCLFTPDQMRQLVKPEVWHQAGGQEALLRPVEEAWQPAPEADWTRVAVAEQHVYMHQQLLRDADWASMRHSLEVRTPLVDRRLTQQLGPLLAAQQGRDGKGPLASSPELPLPAEITRRPKTGFGLPMQTWMQEDCRAGRIPQLPEWLSGKRQRPFVHQLAKGVANGQLHWSRIWALRVLEAQLQELARDGAS
ncbi:MAG: asparagine synthase (glutamine-hydrolyzing) [Acidobacteriota bacterium]